MSSTHEPTATMEPCRFHLQGRCMYGGSCKHSHEPVSDIVAIRVLENLPLPLPANEYQQARSSAWRRRKDGHNGAVGGLRADVDDFVPTTGMADFYIPVPRWVEDGTSSNSQDCGLLHTVDKEDETSPSGIVIETAPHQVIDTDDLNQLQDISNKFVQKMEEAMADLAIKKANGDYNEITRDYDGTIVAFRTGPEVSSIELPTDSSTLQITDLPSGATAETVAGLLNSLGYPTTESCIQITLTKDASIAKVKYNDASSARKVTKTFEDVAGEAEPGEVAMKSLASAEIFGYLGSHVYKNSVRCTWSRPHGLKDKEELSEAVDKLLRQNGGQIDWFEHRQGTRWARAAFSEVGAAEKAIQSLNNTSPHALALGRDGKLYINQVIYVRYNLPKTITNALKSELDALARDLRKNGVRLKIQTQAWKINAMITITGEILNQIVRAKSTIEGLLQGKIVKKGGSALWDPYFETAEALQCLGFLRRAHKLYVHRDSNKCQLLIYSGSTAQQAAVTEALVAKVKWLRPEVHQLVLKPILLGIAKNGGMLRVRQRFGGAAKLDVSGHPKMMTMSDTTTDKFTDAVGLLLGPEYKKTKHDEECAVCGEEAEQALRTSCGHVYCKDCFEHQCNSAFGLNPISTYIRCFGDKYMCNHSFTFNELRSLLSSDTFESLLRSAFDAYIGANCKDLRYCPTPDCTQVYRPTTTGDVVTCSRCLTPICTTCHTISHAIVHAGLSCKEVQDLGAGGQFALEKWKTEFGAKDCPKCGTLITKVDGCDHIQCLGCKVHICWSCMQIFEDSVEDDAVRLIYEHMDAVHPFGGEEELIE